MLVYKLLSVCKLNKYLWQIWWGVISKSHLICPGPIIPKDHVPVRYCTTDWCSNVTLKVLYELHLSIPTCVKQPDLTTPCSNKSDLCHICLQCERDLRSRLHSDEGRLSTDSKKSRWCLCPCVSYSVTNRSVSNQCGNSYQFCCI